MKKIRFYLTIQCLGSLFLASWFSHFTTKTTAGYAFLIASIAVALTPLVAGIVLFAMTFFPITTGPDGHKFFDPKLRAWAFARKLDKRGWYGGEIRWCSMNWKIIGGITGIALFIGIIAFLVITLASIPAHPHRPIGLKLWMKIIGATVLAVCMAGAPILFIGKLANRYEEARTVAITCCASYYAIALVLFVRFGTNGWISGFILLGKMAVGILAISVAMGIVVLVANGSVKLGSYILDKTAFGQWARNLCPTLYPLPTKQ